MRSIWLHEQDEERAFAEKTAQEFSENPGQYSAGDLTAGSLLGLRWGMGQDGVLVLKLDEAHEPANYMEIVQPTVDALPDGFTRDPFNGELMIAFNINGAGRRIWRRLALRNNPEARWVITGFSKPLSSKQVISLPGFNYLGPVRLEREASRD